MLCLRKGTFDMHYFLMCRSMTVAQSAVRALQRAGIYASAGKAPQTANPHGCTYGAKIGERNLSAALVLLQRQGITIDKILEFNGNTVREVSDDLP